MAAGTASVAKVTLEKLNGLLKREEELSSWVRTREIKDVLRTMIDLVKDADLWKEDKGGVITWAIQLRELAYDVEDILDELMLHFGQQSHKSGSISALLHGIAHPIKHFSPRSRISTQLQEIKTRLDYVSMRREIYRSHYIDEEKPANATRYHYKLHELHDHHVPSLFIEEPEVVGIVEPREKLIDWLLDEKEPGLQVISVVGTGGLGKTTLARKVYDDGRVKRCFRGLAWITVMQSSTTEELFRSITNQIFEERNEPLPGRLDMMDDIQLIEILRRYLTDKRYVIVLDNLWNVVEWDRLKYAFPDTKHGSRIIVTTRIRQVASSCTESYGGHVYELNPMPEPEAWKLFCKKAFQSARPPTPEKEEISREIVRKCGGFPLVIAAIGGLLSKKQDILEWKTLRDSLYSEMDTRLAHITWILLLSYEDLPYYLKSCFLYFAIFPKSYSIKRITLIRLWIAEGFVDADGTRRTLEEIAEGYLNELIDRSMVQVAEFYDYGRVRSCRVHDLIREVIVQKSKEENFSTAITRQSMHVKEGETIRRLSFHNASEDALQELSTSRLRALLVFGSNAKTISSMHAFFSGLKLLRILDLEGAPIKEFPTELGKLLHLRYLSLRNTRIHKLSTSVGKLKSLQTLDLKGTYVTELPSKILKLENLRHLLAYQYCTGHHPPFYYALGVKVPRGIGNLTKLQKLTYIEANQDSGILEELGKLTQLKRLGIVKLRRGDGRVLCSAVAKMCMLNSFSATSTELDEPLDLHSLESPPPFLQRLYLRGPLETLPPWFPSLINLVRLRLRWSRLGEDSLGAIQDLPNLVELTLIRAFEGESFHCKRGGFKKLKMLALEQLDKLQYVTVGGAMPDLQKMYIRSCAKLEMVPSGIDQLSNLKELHLFDMPEVFLDNLQRDGGRDHQRVKHIPIIRCYDNEDRLRMSFREL